MNGGAARRRRRRGFTLLEVTIASAILALALFAILRLCAAGLRTARALDRVNVDAASLAAELSLTNRLDGFLGVERGDFGQLYPGYSWMREVTEFNTNGLYQVSWLVTGGSGTALDESRLTILLYRPDSVRRAGL
jgi:prepilin-type N-terminal cleavage/methylation domain-containing protein